MGTNFYWIEKLGGDDEPIILNHIGKRSAAGLFCWDCGIHKCAKYRVMFTHCPSCNKEFKLDELQRGRRTRVSKTGIGTCTSFTWTMLKHKWMIQKIAEDDRKTIRAHGIRWGRIAQPCICNEYGDTFTAQQFLEEELSGVVIERINTADFS